MLAPLYYWDKKKNFGDLIGPWIVEELSGYKTINVKDKIKVPGVACVGSIINMIAQDDIHVWGAGLISKLDQKTTTRLIKHKPAFGAVRGWRTYKELTDVVGAKVPKIYGDPALLCPRIYRPSENGFKYDKISLVPHFSHLNFVSNLDDSFDIINVASHPKEVIDRIVASNCCISTSLHGVIIAQAYGVPWVWLEIEGHKLSGTNFKFEDFFTVLERNKVSNFKLDKKSLDSTSLKLIAGKSYLPKNKFNFDSLYDAFPIDMIKTNLVNK